MVYANTISLINLFKIFGCKSLYTKESDRIQCDLLTPSESTMLIVVTNVN